MGKPLSGRGPGDMAGNQADWSELIALWENMVWILMEYHEMKLFDHNVLITGVGLLISQIGFENK